MNDILNMNGMDKNSSRNENNHLKPWIQYKYQEAKLNRLMIIFDHTVDEDRLWDVIDSSLGYVSFL